MGHEAIPLCRPREWGSGCSLLRAQATEQPEINSSAKCLRWTHVRLFCEILFFLGEEFFKFTYLVSLADVSVCTWMCVSVCASMCVGICVFLCVSLCLHVCLCVCVSLCHNACVEIREQPDKGVGSFLPSRGSWGLNYGFHAWRQMSLLTEISCQHNF